MRVTYTADTVREFDKRIHHVFRKTTGKSNTIYLQNKLYKNDLTAECSTRRVW